MLQRVTPDGQMYLRDAEPGEYRDLDTVENDAIDYGSRKYTCQR